MSASIDSLNCRRTLSVDGKDYQTYSLPAAAETLGDIARLPFSLKVLLENLLRHEDGKSVTREDIEAMAEWLGERRSRREIAFRPRPRMLSAGDRWCFRSPQPRSDPP